jgi:group I intron endonuclease
MIIYKVLNKINGKSYIGQTKNKLSDRQYQHINSALIKDSDMVFHRALKKYGINNFEWNIICECNTLEELNEKEIFFIDKFKTLVPTGYNISIGGSNLNYWLYIDENRRKLISAKISNANKGRIQTEEEKRKRSESCKKSCKGKPLSEESKQKLRDANIGKIISEETRRKISAANTGRKRLPISAETRLKLSISHMGKSSIKKGSTLTSEHKKKISNALTGRKLTAEHIEHSRLGNIGKKRTDETKQKISESNKGNRNALGCIRTPETKKKMSIARKKSMRDEVIITCQQCGNIFKVPYGKRARKYCNNRCAADARTGNNNPSKRFDVRQKISNTKKGKPCFIGRKYK